MCYEFFILILFIYSATKRKTRALQPRQLPLLSVSADFILIINTAFIVYEV